MGSTHKCGISGEVGCMDLKDRGWVFCGADEYYFKLGD